jgi:hypothetical protein
MPLPEMHGRTHVPAGHAAVVQVVTDPNTLIEQGTTDQIPSVLGTAAGSKPWIELDNLGQTLASTGLFAPSLMTDAYWDPLLVTTPDLGSDLVFELNVENDGTNDYWQLTTRPEGWFTLELVHLWSNISALSTTPAYATQQINFNTSGIPFIHDRNPGSATDWANAVTEINGYAYLHTYRTVWLPGSKQWPVNVKQLTGDNRDCSGHLKVWYEAGNFGGSDDRTDWSFASV